MGIPGGSTTKPLGRNMCETAPESKLALIVPACSMAIVTSEKVTVGISPRPNLLHTQAKISEQFAAALESVGRNSRATSCDDLTCSMQEAQNLLDQARSRGSY